MSENERNKSEIAKKEEEILKYWQDNKIFEKSLEKSKDGEPFVFYDGPPFATGTPHYGHLVASAIKDVIPRYQTMKGRFVERQWGWDTHGLPIENIVEKELGIKNKKEIEEVGIEKFNNLCREKLFTYVDAWNEFIPRFGRWADMSNPYQTLDASYMESEWWAFKELYEKGLIYKDYRSMHICPRCETTLAQAEVAEGYKDVKDLAVTAKFELVDEPGTFVLAWTTTPWTLPGNVALAVGEDIDYVKIEKRNEGEEDLIEFILAKNKLEEIFGSDKYEVVEEFKGKDLVGKSYLPLFNDYAEDESLENRENGWKIYSADFVTTEDGTGVVHIAPAFGEDDMNLGKERSLPFIQHIGMDGIIKPQVKELAGRFVKPKDDIQATDVLIIKILNNKGLLFSKGKYEHSYPHCWRCETPLLNFATSSWFVSVLKVKDDLLKYSEDISWSPKHIKEGRWADWLSNARDWSISRQRFWANTIPVWENKESGERIVIGGVDDFKKYTKNSGNKYLVMRHGEAKSNTLNRFDSGNDPNNHLTEEGRRTVLERAKELKGNNIDLVISSPVLRTKETAEIVASELGAEVIYDDRIKEKNFGDHDGELVSDHHGDYGDIRDKFNMRCPNGEDEKDVRIRMGEFIYDIENKYQNKTILIVSHGTPIHFLFAAASGDSNKETLQNDDYFKNTEVRELVFTRLPHNGIYELDLHRPYVDEIELVDEEGRLYERVSDVLDTWFDSGSVPFSSYHYPFENKDKIQKRIPADFIAEGLDQVSKWFYYQHVLSGSLFKKNAFKNVIVNGIVLAEDGKKMSKRLQNFPDPVTIIDKYGADAVRFYLLSSSVVRAENLSFSESGVDDSYKKVILRLQNVLSFYELYKEDVEADDNSPNLLDKWIISRLGELGTEVTRGLDLYELDKASRPFLDFIDDLSTWYIRRSRDRFKGEDREDKLNAIRTTKLVLLNLSRLLAPFTPFLAEDLYKKTGGESESVHLDLWPENYRIDDKLLEDMLNTRKVVSFGLESRAIEGIKVRQPLETLTVKGEELDGDLISLIKDEVNVKNVLFDKNLEKDVLLNTEITSVLKEEGNARDLIRHIQSMRKEKGLKPNDVITLNVSSEGDLSFMDKFENEIKKVCGIKEIIREGGEEEVRVGENTLKISIV